MSVKLPLYQETLREDGAARRKLTALAPPVLGQGEPYGCDRGQADKAQENYYTDSDSTFHKLLASLIGVLSQSSKPDLKFRPPKQ